jgi:hypothetical protein
MEKWNFTEQHSEQFLFANMRKRLMNKLTVEIHTESYKKKMEYLLNCSNSTHAKYWH